MLIKGESAYLEINLISRSRPESKDYWDGNWIVSEIKTSIPGFTANVSLELRSDELFNLLEVIPGVVNGSTSEFVLRTLEGAFYLKGEVEEIGNIKWRCSITYPVGDGAVLEFGFNSDFFQIHSFREQLEVELQSYPIIGTP